MFGSKSLLKRIDTLEKKNVELEKQIWLIRNPHFEKGTKVNIYTVQKKGKVLTIDLKTDVYKGFYSHRWVYGVLCGDDLITSSNVEKI